MTVLGPGVRVKCVESDWKYYVNGSDGCGPAVGSVWTVSEIKTFDKRKITAIKLAEWQDYSWFDADQFIPLDGNEDISVFTEMLTKLPAPSKLPATPTLVPAS